MDTWKNEDITLQLGRFPYDAEERSLRAWNGADTLLVEHIRKVLPEKGKHVLILNDSFGALACASAALGFQVTTYIDSALSLIACRENLKKNSLDSKTVNFIDNLEGQGFLKIQPDIVLMHVPKGNLLLEYQLDRLGLMLKADTEICAGGMTRDIHTSAIQLFEKCIGTTHTSLAAHKARLIHSTFAVSAREAEKPAALQWPRIQVLEEKNLPKLELVNFPGVFSAGGHDRGSLLLLEYLSETAGKIGEVSGIIDCGCGNGLLALAAAKFYPKASVVCADESFMAIESARAGFLKNGMADRSRFAHCDCLAEIPPDSAGLILCNPPFHMGHGQSQTLSVAHRMFEQSRRCLRRGGSLIVVSNKHLGHRAYLLKLFDRIDTVRENEQFTVLRAQLD